MRSRSRCWHPIASITTFCHSCLLIHLWDAPMYPPAQSLSTVLALPHKKSLQSLRLTIDWPLHILRELISPISTSSRLYRYPSSRKAIFSGHRVPHLFYWFCRLDTHSMLMVSLVQICLCHSIFFLEQVESIFLVLVLIFPTRNKCVGLGKVLKDGSASGVYQDMPNSLRSVFHPSMGSKSSDHVLFYVACSSHSFSLAVALWHHAVPKYVLFEAAKYVFCRWAWQTYGNFKTVEGSSSFDSLQAESWSFSVIPEISLAT